MSLDQTYRTIELLLLCASLLYACSLVIVVVQLWRFPDRLRAATAPLDQRLREVAEAMTTLGESHSGRLDEHERRLNEHARRLGVPR